MNTRRAFDPQFDRIRPQAETTPVGRPRHVRVFSSTPFVDTETLPRFFDSAQQLRSRGNRLTLLAGPRADATLDGARSKVRIALGFGCLDHASFHANLPMQVVPVQYHRRTTVREQLATLARLVVRIEHDVAPRRLDVLAQHD